MVKAHNRINWENYPSDATPLNESNLNKIDVAVDEIDNRVITLDVMKLDKTTAATMVKDVSFDEITGIFTITYLNGATINLDTKLEKLAVNFSWNAETQQLIIILDDGTKQYVDLSSLITVYEFLDSDVIAFTVDGDGKVTATIKSGSITADMLQPNFLADIKVEAAKAEAAVESAEDAANLAKSYAVGTENTVRENDSTDNAKYYYENSKEIYENFSSAGNVTGVKGNAETAYRIGNVNITPEDIGALATDGDVTNNTVSFEEASELANLTSGEKMSTAFGKISRAIKGYMSHILIKGSTSGSGHVALSDSSAVTDSTGLALPATEKNASIGGTLANQISALNNNLTNKANTNHSHNVSHSEVTLETNDYIDTDNSSLELYILDDAKFGILVGDITLTKTIICWQEIGIAWLSKTPYNIKACFTSQCGHSYIIHSKDNRIKLVAGYEESSGNQVNMGSDVCKFSIPFFYE